MRPILRTDRCEDRKSDRGKQSGDHQAKIYGQQADGCTILRKCPAKFQVSDPPRDAATIALPRQIYKPMNAIRFTVQAQNPANSESNRERDCDSEQNLMVNLDI